MIGWILLSIALLCALSPGYKRASGTDGDDGGMSMGGGGGS